MMKINWTCKDENVGCQYFFTQHRPVVVCKGTALNKIAPQASPAWFQFTVLCVNRLHAPA